MKNALKKTFAIVVSFAMALGLFSNVMAVSAKDAEYEIYPTPHKITYENGDFILKDKVNVVYEDGIDSYTKDRLKEVTDLKGLTISTSKELDSSKTNILVGIKGSNGYVDEYVKKYSNYSKDLFNQLDAYYLKASDGTIVILGKDTDAAFYGLTTLYMVVGQLESRTIRNFTVEDYSDVASRGFIEGYYGNPWSTEDRANLMTWGGYYKLNSYFYAPKDDPKHNAKWRELYTEDEINTKIKPLAQAGNASKCRFVFALHPFMNNAIKFNSLENYQADLKVLQAKFEQVIKAGVRQIAILADDAANYNNTGNLGGNNYKRLLTDMTNWLKEMQKEYPDLKLTLPFCPVEYGGYGEKYYTDFPDNVQVVMTGGKVWGEVSNHFTSSFTNNVGRGPYMWINWPCTDNSKKHLIMGGYDTFLQPGVNPEKIQGIVLNPMQQSEPSKVAIFGNACYSWNIWESKEEADNAWNNSFKYVDHNSALETDASEALKELSKHMINQAMDTRVTALQESVDLKEKLNSFKEKLANDAIEVNDVDAMIKEFEVLQDASKTYRLQAGNKDTAKQIVYWLDCWDDTTQAAIAYLKGVKAIINKDTSGILSYNNEGQEAFAKSKTHGFHYVNHTEYAEVGVQHIVPFINTVANYVSQYAQTSMDPDKVVATFITNRKDTPSGNTNNVFDGKDDTMVSYQNPVWIYQDDYVGVKYNKKIAIENIRFLLGNGKNHMEASKLQYTVDGNEWKDITLKDMNNQFTGVKDKYLEIIVKKENLPENFEAMGIRLIATAKNKLDAYLNVHEIQINKTNSEDEETISGVYSTNIDQMNATSFDVLSDGQNGSASASEVWLSKRSGENKDQLPAGSYLMYTLNKKQKIQSVTFAQGGSVNGDVIKDGELQYLDDQGQWQTIDKITNEKVQSFDLSNQNINARVLRIYNKSLVSVWWRVGEFRVEVDGTSSQPLQYNVIKTDRWKLYQGKESHLYDGSDDSYVWYDPDGDSNSTNDDALVNDFIGYDFGKVATLEKIHIVVGNDSGDKLQEYAIETSINNQEWTAIDGYADYKGNQSGKDIIDMNVDGLKARYIRIRNLKQQGSWIKFSEFTVQELQPVVGTTEYLFTNVDNPSLLSQLKDGKASLTDGKITLQKDEYIGLDLHNIKHLNDISGSYGQLKLEVSKNTIEWNNYAKGTDARYVRLINNTGSEIDVNVSDVSVTFDYIGKKTVTSDFENKQSSDDMRTAGSVENVFDGNLSTIGMINGPQVKGKHITFDLGRITHFESLRYYIVETQLNYLRDADFEVSVDGTKWTKVLHVGKEVPDKADTTVAKDMQDITLKHDSSNPGYMYAEKTGLNVDGRYIRITPTSTYSHRWVGINELVINNGEYVSLESNRDIISQDIEVDGKIPSNMIDKDYSTSYKSTAKNSSFTYSVSEPQNKRTIRIVQSGAVSHAKVVATVYTSTRSVETLELGTLNQTISEFVLPEGKTIKDIKVSWEEIVPEILEMALYSNADEATEAKTALKTEIDKPINQDHYTQSSIDKYTEAKKIATEVYKNQYASLSSVNMAKGLLLTARNELKDKFAYDNSELKQLIETAISNDNGYYSASSYAKYESTLLSAKEAVKKIDDLSQEDGNILQKDLKEAFENLSYSISFREQAQLLYEEELILDEKDYSQESLKAYKDAKNVLKEAIEKDKAATNQSGRISPDEFVSLIEAYNKAKRDLVAAANGTLKALIDELNSFDQELYDAKTFNAYRQAIEDGKKLLDSKQDEIFKQIKTIRLAKESMIAKNDLHKIIQDALKVDKNGYSEKSYEALMKVVKEAQELTDQTRYDEYCQMITQAKTSLVNIVALKEKVEKVENLDSSLYTKVSYEKLMKKLTEADKVMKEGTQEEVDNMIQTLTQAVSTLKLSGQKEYEEYMKSIKLKDEELYTEDSYKIYKAAYNHLVNLGDDVSVEEFTMAKVNFEESTLLLQYRSADYSQVDTILNKVPADLSQFDQNAVKALQEKMNKVDRTLTILEQDQVNQYATDLQKALDAVLKSMNPQEDEKPSSPEISVKPGSGNGTTSGHQNTVTGQGANVSQNTTNSSSTVETGDPGVPSIIIIPFIVSLAVFSWLLLTKKRRL